MIDQHFPPVTASTERAAEALRPLRGGERVLWRGRAGVAEYAFDQRASLPRWTLPETTTLIVTDQRVMYAHTASGSPDDRAVTSGELCWLWPQHVRVQPGTHQTGRAAAATQIQLVCGGADGSWPALVFAGGDLTTVGHVDRLANLIRQSIARFRVDNAGGLGLTTAQSRMLSRLLIGPEFSNYQGGPGQTVSIQGALLVSRPTAAAPGDPAEHTAPAHPTGAGPATGSPVAAALSAPIPAPVSPAPVVSPTHRAIPPTHDPLFDDSPTRDLRSHSSLADGTRSHGPFPNDLRSHDSSTRDLSTWDVPTRDSPTWDDDSTRDSTWDVSTRDSPMGDVSTRDFSARDSSTQGFSGRGFSGRGDAPAPVGGDATRVISVRPGIAADMARALQAAKAEAAAQEAEPDLASRAADLAARVANLVTQSTALDEDAITGGQPHHYRPIVSHRAPTTHEDLDAAGRFDEMPTTDLTERTAVLRRMEARFAANSAGNKAGIRGPDRDLGATRGQHSA